MVRAPRSKSPIPARASRSAREHLFEAFADSVGGTGLGLAIAHELARNHGGRLELLKSDPTGTVFRAIFPNSVESLREQ